LYPAIEDEEEDAIPSDYGSFFNYFEDSKDPYEVSMLYVSLSTLNELALDD